MIDLKPVQLRPPQSEELADQFERLAQLARDGEVIGFSAIIIKPDSKWEARGFQGNDVNSFQEVGMHFFAMMDIYNATLK